MESPGLVILAILGIGAVTVLLPVALSSFSRNQRPRVVVCPRTQGPATIGLDPGRAAAGSIFGKSWLTVERCTLWPENGGCDQGCVPPARPADESAVPTA
jgi:hypothetical protein